MLPQLFERQRMQWLIGLLQYRMQFPIIEVNRSLCFIPNEPLVEILLEEHTANCCGNSSWTVVQTRVKSFQPTVLVLTEHCHFDLKRAAQNCNQYRSLKRGCYREGDGLSTGATPLSKR